jgi:hypothetical protein
MEAVAVGREVSNPRNEGPRCLAVSGKRPAAPSCELPLLPVQAVAELRKG